MRPVEIIPPNALEVAPFFVADWHIAKELALTFNLEAFEEIVWLAGRLSPRSIQISRESKYLKSDEIVAGDIIRRLATFIDDGYSIAVNFVENLSSMLARHIQKIGEDFSCVANGSVFFSPPQGATFCPHYDAIDVLAIQLEGSKIWRVSNAPTSLPLSKNTYLVEGVTADGDDFKLTPGSALYVPRGKVHDVRAADCFSLHLSVGLGSLSNGAIIKKSVDMQVEASIALRKTNIGSRGRSSNIYSIDPMSLPTFDDYSLRIAEQSLHASALSKQPQLPGRLRTLLDAPFINRRSYLVRSYPCEITREYIVNGIVGLGFPGLAAGRFSQNNAFLTFPERALVCLEFIRDVRGPFKPDDIAGSLAIEEKVVLARRLVKEGLLQPSIG